MDPEFYGPGARVKSPPGDTWLMTQAYLMLLKLSFGESRANLQPVLAGLRNEIARVKQQDPQEVQDHFEDVARRI